MKTLLAFVLMALIAPAFADDPLFADMGGKPGLDRLVDASVALYLNDPRIKDVFAESNIDRLRAQLKDQFCVVAGGPCVYTGHSMQEAHKGLHLRNGDFNALVEDLQTAMDAQGIAFPVQNLFLARLAPMQHQVVTQ